MEQRICNQPQVAIKRNCYPQDPTHCVVSGALALILRISSFFGLAPLRFVSHNNVFTITASKSMRIYSYILITVLVTWTLLGILAEYNAGMDNATRMTSTTVLVSMTIKISLTLVITIIGVYGAPKRMNKLFSIVERLASVDQYIYGKYQMKSERRHCAALFGNFIFLLILLVIDICRHAMRVKKSGTQWNCIINYASFYVLWLTTVILELQFTVTAFFAKARFTAINNVLAETVKRAIDDTCLTISESEAVRRLAVFYATLCDVVQGINESYSTLLIFSMVSIPVDITFVCYIFIVDIIKSSSDFTSYVFLTIWSVIHIARMWVIIEPCHKTATEGIRTESLLCRLMNDVHPTGPLSVRLQMFSTQLKLRRIAYIPLETFSLNRPLMTSAFGAITTYLVILVQFQAYDK